MRFTIGVILVLAGLITLAVPTFTFHTSEHLANTDYFHLDNTVPHSIVINPVVSVIALVAGSILILFSRRRRD